MTDQKIPAPVPPKPPGAVVTPVPTSAAVTNVQAPPPSSINKMSLPNPTQPPQASQPPRPQQSSRPSQISQPPAPPKPMMSAPPVPPISGGVPPVIKMPQAPMSTTPAPASPGAPTSPPRPLQAPTAPPRPPVNPTPLTATLNTPSSLPNLPKPPAPLTQPPQPAGPPKPGSFPPPGGLPKPGALPQPGALPKPAPAAGSTPTPSPTTTPVKAAEFKQSPLRFLPLVVAILVVAGLGFFIFQKLFGGGKSTSTITTTTGGSKQTGGSTGTTGTTGGTSNGQLTTLTYWGLWEPSDTFTEVLNDYQKDHPNIRIEYQMQSYKDIRERLQTAIASGRGPDIFRFHASWTPMMKDSLTPLPSSAYTPTDFQNTFYPVATQQLTYNNQIYGIPLEYDGLALLYNQDALRAANLKPPQTWADVKDMAPKLTIMQNGKVERAGMAIGSAANVDNFSDILALLILQNGGSLTDPTSPATIDAVTFYTNFMKANKVWDENLPNSTVAFARGSVAMILVPSWRIHDIKAMSPNLNFGVVQVPQLASQKVSWGTYWAEGVSSQSKHQTEAWDFLKYLSSQPVLRKLYSAAAKNRAFGEIYSRRDMASELASDPNVSPYLTDAPYAQGWFLSADTHDNGINDQMIKYYQDAVTAIVDNNTAVATALATVKQGSDQVLRTYNVPVTGSSAGSTNTSSVRQ